MTHSFEVDIATKFGIEAAIILHDLFYWVVKNKANDVNYYDGRYWDYNSTSALKELYPYMKEYTITTTLKRLKEKGIILTGCFNKLPFDRTTWYTLTDAGWSLFKGKEIDVLKTGNALFENEVFDTQENSVFDGRENSTLDTQVIKEPIPTHKVLSNESTSLSYNQQSMFSDIEDTKDIQSNKDIVSTKNSKSTTKQDKISLKNKIIQLINSFTEDESLRKDLNEFVEHRKKAGKPVATEHAMDLLLRHLKALSNGNLNTMREMVDTSIRSGWLDFYPPKNQNNTTRRERGIYESDEEDETPIPGLW